MNMTEEQQKRENNQEEWIEEQLGRKDQQVKVEKNWKKGNTRTTEMREIHSRITGKKQYAEEQYKRNRTEEQRKVNMRNRIFKKNGNRGTRQRH